MLVEKAILQYRPPQDYDNLKDLLMTVGLAEQYLAMIQQLTPNPHPLTHFIPPSQAMQLLPQGVPMDIDWKRYLRTSTRPQAIAASIYYNY